MDVSFESAVLERIRRSVVLLAPGHPGGLDREAAIKVLEELQRLQGRDRRIKELLDEVVAMLEAG
jgi:transposase